MKPTSVRIHHDETASGNFKVTVSYHERDTPERLGHSADIFVYIDAKGRGLPEAAPAISTEAITRARQLLRRVLDETGEHNA